MTAHLITTHLSGTSAPRMHPVRRIAAMIAVMRQRRDLARLDSKALEDIGLTREAALNEASKPLWDVPAYWR